MCGINRRPAAFTWDTVRVLGLKFPGDFLWNFVEQMVNLLAARAECPVKVAESVDKQ